MKQLNGAYLFLILAIAFSSCVSNETIITPTWTQMQLPSPTSVSSTPTRTLQPTQTPPATLEPEQAKEIMKTLLRELVDCRAPCFWGIMPGQTTLGEAKNIFTHLGLQLEHTNTQDSKDFYGLIHKFDTGLQVTPVLTIRNHIVENLSVGITPETQKANVPREWFAYSPETLIKQYGTPSRVSFALDWGPRSFFDMVMRFDTVELIVEYTGYDIMDGTAESPQVCPLADQFDSVRLWMGQDPRYPPPEVVPLEEATSMMLEEFANLIMGNPDTACFNLKKEVFQ
jgi:hypothetical protein